MQSFLKKSYIKSVKNIVMYTCAQYRTQEDINLFRTNSMILKTLRTILGPLTRIDGIYKYIHSYRQRTNEMVTVYVVTFVKT